MNIQQLSNTQKYKTSFGQNSRRFEDTSELKQQNINATLYDLYKMEDRIKKQNADLFAKQNKLLGQTLDSIARIAYLTVCENSDVHAEFDRACDNTYLLANDGKKGSSVTYTI